MSKFKKEQDKIRDKTGINVDKYLTNDFIDRITGYIDSFGLFFWIFALLPATILNVLFITASVAITKAYDKPLYGILFFVFSLVVSLIGGGLLGLKYSIRNMSDAVNGLAKYSFEIVKEIYKSRDKAKKGTFSGLPDTIRLVIYCVILPVTETVLFRRLFVIGSLIYWGMEKLLFNLTKAITDYIEKNDTGENNSAEESPEAEASRIENKLDELTKKVDGFSKGVSKGVTISLNILSAIAICLGAIPLIVMLIIFKVV